MILLDDAQSTPEHPSSRLYREPIGYWSVYAQRDASATAEAIHQCLLEIDQALSKGEHIVAAFAYELGRVFHHLKQRNAEPSSPRHPLIEAWSFSAYRAMGKSAVDEFLADQLNNLDPSDRISGVADIKSSIDEHQFTKDIAAIQEYIRNGDTYQINHTFRITGEVYGNPLALYTQLRDRQPGRFGAYISEGRSCILSQSPELFIQRQGNILKAMPMKGTASALTNSADELSADAKNRAENVMIVDLLRNDLSRLALPGTVTVPHLFDVTRHGDVLQMTSTIQAQAKDHVRLADVLQAVFPCGSVTGAPKKRSMEIIQDLESKDRGYYCGALGWLDPDGDFAFSVPIRTLEIERDQNALHQSFSLGIGAGITIDSDAQAEWEECKIKAAFLRELPSAVDLFETILVKNAAAQHLDLHLARLAHSATALGIDFSLLDAQNGIVGVCQGCEPNKQYRLRLELKHTGSLNYQVAELEPLAEAVKIFWASEILPDPALGQIHSGNVLLGHKVSHRSVYDAAWKTAEQLGGFDAIFINEQGFVTEGGRTSIFIKSADGKSWLTPPVSAGVLPGVMRSVILGDPHWNAHEANLTIDDVSDAKEIMLTNALRGTVTAHF
ncbi:bifunctional chorismate-binding protein/class IV aminotransferase [Polynucleobacter sp. AP-Nino-20-G2]|uniref:bifunctional chorismate-binding protein/class IV aminotransferase n=1 Tax=Polynucleobacter sp. AP-Nino-20-G2 TaxID=2576917 RepID=UPI001BFE5EF0|nr:bifunctional chorismate-binding protein/class IV aminotransferase [Polynucleobacter sp. AP-Nino-20-G2]QWE15797.1 chorismate-binding protein [Polynucleobacter sp. AP-Nino-20-G2]